MTHMKKRSIALGLLLSAFLFGCSAPETSSPTASSEASGKQDTSIVSSEISVASSGEKSGQSSSNSKSGSSAQTSTPVESVSLNKTSFTIYVGDSPVTLTATVSPARASNKNVTWHTSKANVATVSSGVVTPVSAGEATIMVVTEDGSKSASCTVTVKERPNVENYVLYGLFKGKSSWTAKELLINSFNTSERLIQGLTLYKDDLFQIHMYGNEWRGYSDLKKSVPSGLVTKGEDDAIKVVTTGVYDIYCDSNYSSSDRGYIYLQKVGNVDETVHVESVTLNRTAKYLGIGDRFYLEPTILPSNATNQEVTWSTGNSNVAVVVSGWVSGVAEGKTKIFATSKDGGKVAECTVFVSEKPAFYLVGTINGQTVEIGNTEYATIFHTVDEYLIADVHLAAGDEIKIYNTATEKIVQKYAVDYVFRVSEAKFGDFYLDILSPTKNYLRFVER